MTGGQESQTRGCQTLCMSTFIQMTLKNTIQSKLLIYGQKIRGLVRRKVGRPDYKRKSSSSQPDSQEQPETMSDTETDSEDEDEIEGAQAGSDFENEEWVKLDEVGGAGSFDFGNMMFE